MRILDLDYWKEKSVQERIEILEKANAKPSLFRLLLIALHQWLEEPKKPELVDSKVFNLRHRRW